MIWTTRTHEFAATLCRRTGRPCPALSALAENLARALRQAEPMTDAGFAIEGHCEMPPCGAGCMARYAASHSRIRVFCGVDEDTALSHLNRFADALMTPDGAGFAAGLGPVPCAMAEARPRCVHSAATAQATA
ncbi:hypothetical protein MB818_17295 [Ruegeria sp. 1NDH52C]|uniref:Uncharacterized protein n=1 Tax=Ruegeria alba TaxID=2916756 RepID=A0ABS9P0K8_9RHOB|nr:hypothetical protein [Ruegeria alba]MCG6559969.1 hypothetical protein [Ruegeria alba]